MHSWQKHRFPNPNHQFQRIQNSSSQELKTNIYMHKYISKNHNVINNLDQLLYLPAMKVHHQHPPNSQPEPTSILGSQQPQEANPHERRYCTKQEIFNHETVYINSEDFSNSPSFLKMSYENTPVVLERKGSIPNKQDRQQLIQHIRQLSQQDSREMEKTHKKLSNNYGTPPTQSERKKDNKQNAHSARSRAIYRNIHLDNVSMSMNMNVDWSLYEMDNLINIVDNMYEKAIDRKIQCNVNIQLRANRNNGRPGAVQPHAQFNSRMDQQAKKGVTIQIEKLKLMQKCREKFKQLNLQHEQNTSKKQQKYYEIIAEENDDERCLSTTQRVSIELLPESNQNQHKCKQQEQEEPLQMQQHHLQSQSQSQFISSARQHNTSYKESCMEPIQLESQNSEQSERYVYRMQPIKEMGSERRNKHVGMKDMEFGSSQWRKPVVINYKVTKCNDDGSRARRRSNSGVIKKQDQIKQQSISKIQFHGTPIMRLPIADSQLTPLPGIANVNSNILSDTSNNNQPKNNTIIPSNPTNNNNNSNNNNNNNNPVVQSSQANPQPQSYSSYKGVYQQILSQYTTAKLLAISKQQYHPSIKNTKPNPKQGDDKQMSSKASKADNNTNRNSIKSKSQDRSTQRQSNAHQVSHSMDKHSTDRKNNEGSRLGLCFVNNHLELFQGGPAGKIRKL